MSSKTVRDVFYRHRRQSYHIFMSFSDGSVSKVSIQSNKDKALELVDKLQKQYKVGRHRPKRTSDMAIGAIVGNHTLQ